MRLTGSFSSIQRIIVRQIGLSLPPAQYGAPARAVRRRAPLAAAGLAGILALHTPASAAPTEAAPPAMALAETVLPGVTPQLPGTFRLAPAMAARMPAPETESRDAPSVCLLPEDCLGPVAGRRLAFAAQDAGTPEGGPAYGPPAPADDGDAASDRTYRSFGSQLGAIKWEMGAILAYYTAINGPKLFEDPTWPHVHHEGWFGRSTNNIGMDKLAHTYSAYVLSDLIYARLKHKTGNAPGIALTAAALGSATMLYTEFWDSIEKTAGWSWEDVAFNSLGSGFSLLRNSVPGLDRKVDFRLMIVPNSNIIDVEGKRHFEQQRYFFAFKFAGFEAFEDSPLRFLELHLGYYARNFTLEDRAAGIRPDRRVFVGVGINLRELFFRDSRSRVGRAAGEVLDYFQPPYTAIQAHITN